MAEKVSFKIVIVIFSLCGILSSCRHPIDIESFLASPEVQAIIETTKAAVKVDDKTGDGLAGRDKRIEGLKNNKYYLVEKEIDENNIPVTKPVYPLFVTDYRSSSGSFGPGGFIDDLGFITRISDGNILGLTNFHTYTVRAAEPITSSTGISYKDDNGTVKKPITNGVINISGICGDGYLDLSTVITAGYEVMAVSTVNSTTSPWNWISKKPANWNSFKLEGANKIIDYVFFKSGAPLGFKVLRVEIGASVEPQTLTLNLDFTEVNGTPAFAPGSSVLRQSNYYNNTPQSVTINILNVGDYTIVGWQYDGKSLSLGTQSSITLNNASDISYFALGKHTLILICTKGGIPYSAEFTLLVEP